MTARFDTADSRPASDADAAPDASPDIDDAEVGERLVSVTFSLPPDVSAHSASVVGDFNGWDPSLGAMDLVADGSFVRTLRVATGRRYQYRFLLDGDRWANDWFAHAYTPNEFGGDDSVLDLTETPDDLDIS